MMASDGLKPSATKRIAVIGSAEFDDYERLKAVVLVETHHPDGTVTE